MPPSVHDDAAGLKRALLQRDQWLAVLADTASHLLSTDDPDAMVRGVFERIRFHFQVDAYFNFMVNEAGDALRMASCAGIPDETARSIQRLEFGQAICGTVAQCRRPITATFIQESDDPKVQLVRGFGIRSYACNPLMAGERLLGTLSFASRVRDTFDENELECFRTICHYTELAIERTRMERRLQQQEKLESVGLLAAGVAHDLNNLLGIMMGSTSLAAEMVEDAEVRSLLNQATDAAERAADLSQQLMAYAGKGRLVARRLDVSDLVRKTAALLQSTIGKVRLQLDIAERLPVVEGDECQLRQVVMNLIINAAEAMEDGRPGLIRVRTGSEGAESVWFEVADNGRGMDEATRARIFDPFFTTKPKGRGLGLSSVSGIIRAHRGELKVASTPGRGSTFRILLPIAPVLPQRPAHTGDAVALPRSA